MNFEASTSSSPSATDPSTTDDHNKRGGGNSTRHPLYRGVWRRSKSNGKWVSEARDRGNGKRSRIWLGTFPNAEMAAAAHDVAALALHGAAAKLNFPESAHADIQRAAGEVINAGESSMHVDNVSEKEGEEEEEVEVEFVDEEAMFNMPLLVDCMAEGMLLTPPALKKGFSWTQHEPHHNFDFTLWDHDH